MKKRNLIFCIVFVAVIAIPLLFFGNQDSQSVLRENRNLSSTVALPEKLSDIDSDFTKSLESYFSDHIGFRNSLVTLANKVRIMILGVNSVSDKVIEGKDGWLFYNPQGLDGDPIGDYLGTKRYTQEDLERFGVYLQQISDCCKEIGADFYLIICPNKASIYGERYLPDYYVKGEGPNRADMLVDYIRDNTDIRCTYVKDELYDYSFSEYVYFKHDTHWTELGAYLAYRDWYEKYAGEQLPLLEDSVKVPIKESNDLSLQLGVELEEETYYTVDLRRGITVEDAAKDMTIGDYYYRSSNKNGKTAMMFRDSFLIYMQPYLCQDFEESIIFSHRMGMADLELIRQEKPDTVIFEMVERYLA